MSQDKETQKNSPIIQMIPVSSEVSIFIIDFNNTTGELTFRTTRNVEMLQREIVEIKDDIVYTNLYNFHVSALQKFLYEKNNL